jgi:hypothetical protein
LELSQVVLVMLMLALGHEDGMFPCAAVGSGTGQPLLVPTLVAPGGVNVLGKGHEEFATSTWPVTVIPWPVAVIPPLLHSVVLDSLPLLVMLIALHAVLAA